MLATPSPKPSRNRPETMLRLKKIIIKSAVMNSNPFHLIWSHLCAKITIRCGNGYEYGVGAGCKHIQFKSHILDYVHKLFPTGDILWHHIGRAVFRMILL